MPGGGHGGGGFMPGGSHGGFFPGRFFPDHFFFPRAVGPWWWNGWAPYVVQQNACSQWGPPLINPSSALIADAAARLAANGDAPVSVQDPSGVLYLFTREGSQVVIRPCIATL
jgi:hypothetical protein